MKRVDGIVGSTTDPDLGDKIAAHEAAGTLETVTLDNVDRQRSRLRVESDAGTDLGVLVDKPELSEGDILVLEDDWAAIVTFESREAFVIELPESALPATIVELGHRIGNQHWDISVEKQTVYVPVEADKTIIEDVLGPYLPDDTETWYEIVDAEQFMNDASPSHGHGVDHDHSHEDGHEHSHHQQTGYSNDEGHNHD
jgi:urease accessory protein